MIIMACAHMQAANDTSNVEKYVSLERWYALNPFIYTRSVQYGLLKKWTDYLRDNTLYPENQ